MCVCVSDFSHTVRVLHPGTPPNSHARIHSSASDSPTLHARLSHHLMGVFQPDSVSSLGEECGWWEHDYQWSQGELVIMRKHDHNGARCCVT